MESSKALKERLEKMTNETLNNNKGNFWVGFFIGGLVGAFIIFVLGTKEGKKLADKIIEQSQEYEGDFEKKVEKLQKQGEGLLKEANEVKEKVVQNIQEGKKTASENLTHKIDKALTDIEKMQKKGVEITQDMHKRYFKKDGKKLNA